MNNAPLNTKDPKSLEVLERMWIEYKKMRFGYYQNTLPQDLAQ